MKNNTGKLIVILFTGLSLLFSCTKDPGNEINSVIRQEFEINAGELLSVSLGSFGDEEGAWIIKNPQHAKVSKIYRQISLSSIIYEYQPQDNYAGEDSVTIILNRGSDGASPGRNDTANIRIIVKK